MRWSRHLAAVPVAALLGAACASSGASPETAAATATASVTAGPTEPAARAPAPSPSPSPSPPPEPEVVLAAGDIAWCGPDEDDTGALLATAPDATVLAVGDLAYESGTPEQYASCYLPAWGDALERTSPVPGNHDDDTPQLAGYFGVFGDRAGPEPGAYHATELGQRWLAIGLNSNCHEGTCDADSTQVAWLRDTLAGAGDRHVLAYWHHPRFSSGMHGDDPRTSAFWDVLAEHGPAIVVTGHDHDYERYVPVDPSGAPDPDGITEFVVGTGGAVLRAFDREAPATSAFRTADAHGVLRLELSDCDVSWAFLTTDGEVLDPGERSLC